MKGNRQPVDILVRFGDGYHQGVANRHVNVDQIKK